LLFWHTTNLTLEDALITFRYADNLADGKGFVYNEGEKVIGTTSPLWTLSLASIKGIGVSDLISASKILGILFDAVTLLLLFTTVRNAASEFAAFVAALLFVLSPDIVPISISGMETPLLLFCMTVAFFGYVKKNLLFPLGLALTIMTRIDGAIFAACLIGASLVSEKRWGLRSTLLAMLILLPWFVFASLYTGSILPQSLLAKMSAYRFDLAKSSMPFIATFTPFLEPSLVKWALKSVLTVGVIVGGWIIVKKYSTLTPAIIFFCVYSLVFMASRTSIFRWYIIPAIFVSYVILGVCCDRLVSFIDERLKVWRFSRPSVIVLVTSMTLIILVGRLDRYRQIQIFEDVFRKEIGLWLNRNLSSGSVVFLEPIGYIGYYAGQQLRIRDEIGIVTPEIVELRKSGPGWYTRAVKALRPDYIVQYQFSIDHNQLEGTNEQLFTNDNDEHWFSENYAAMKTFSVCGSFPLIEDKEKAYVVFQRQ
jgi:hypothetical protein